MTLLDDRGVPVHLDPHAHLDPDGGYCLMEAVSVHAGEAFTDHPHCTHTLLAEIARIVNDALDDTTRQQLATRTDRLAHASAPPTRQASAAIVAAVARAALAAGIEDRRIVRAADHRPARTLPAALEMVADTAYRHGSGRHLIIHITNQVNRLTEPARSHAVIALLDAALTAIEPAVAPTQPRRRQGAGVTAGDPS